MKKPLTKILRAVSLGTLPSLLLLFTLSVAAQAQDYTYTTNNGAITITEYIGPGGDVTIPDTINGLPVTSIGDEAFEFCISLTNVMIPNSVTNIGYWAFVSCTSLTAITMDALNPVYSSADGVLFNKSLTTLIQYPGGKSGSYTIPNSVTSIGNNAFSYCTSLTSVAIPNSVTNLGEYVFYNCTNLTSVYFRGNAPTVGEHVFSADEHAAVNATVYYLPGTTGWENFARWTGRPTVLWNPQAQAYIYTTNNGAITITVYMGSGGDVTIPDTIDGQPVTSIGGSAFAGCASLTNVTIPSSVTNIGTWAFADCYGMMAITVDPLNSVYSSADGVLFNKSQTTLIVCPGGKTGAYAIPNGVTNIGTAFYRCVSLTSITIPNSVISIGNSAFAECSGLTDVTIGSGVTSIGSAAFDHCNSLTAITVIALNPVYSSVDGVLFNKSQTTLILFPPGKAGAYTIPSGVTNIGTAFYLCASLTSVTIPDSVTSISNSAFAECSGLTDVTIGSGVTSIGSAAFDNCNSLTAITVDALNSAYSSVDGALFNKSQTTLILCPRDKVGNYTIPNGVTNIGTAFYLCASLTSVTIPSSVTSIGNSAFFCCTSLIGVYFQGNAPSVDSCEFCDDDYVTVYYLPWTTGWGAMFGGRPTALWFPNPLIVNNGPSFGMRTNRFGFIISWATNISVVVEACTNLANPVWTPIGTNAFNTFIGTNWTSYFSDPDWTNYPARFYRIRLP